MRKAAVLIADGDQMIEQIVIFVVVVDLDAGQKRQPALIGKRRIDKVIGQRQKVVSCRLVAANGFFGIERPVRHGRMRMKIALQKHAFAAEGEPICVIAL